MHVICAESKMQHCSASSSVIHLKDCYDYDAVCPHDSLRFKSMEEWKDHHLKHHMDTKLKCPLCGIKSASWHNYSYHVQTSQHNAVCPSPWICKLRKTSTHSVLSNRCGARFGSKYQLIRHIRSFHPNYKLDLQQRDGCDSNSNRKCKYPADEMPIPFSMTSPQAANVGNTDMYTSSICDLSVNQSTSTMVTSPSSISFPPPKRRKLSHGGPDVVEKVPLSIPLVEGLHDLAVNGGLDLFINALTIFRRNEQMAKQQAATIPMQDVERNSVNDHDIESYRDNSWTSMSSESAPDSSNNSFSPNAQ